MPDGRRTMLRILLVIWAFVPALLLAGCGASESAARTSPPPRMPRRPWTPRSSMRRTAPSWTTLTARSSASAASPSRCPRNASGWPLVGWDWEAVEGEETAGGATWGDYHVVGTFEASCSRSRKRGRTSATASSEATRDFTTAVPGAGRRLGRARPRPGVRRGLRRRARAAQFPTGLRRAVGSTTPATIRPRSWPGAERGRAVLHIMKLSSPRTSADPRQPSARPGRPSLRHAA